MEEVHKPLCKFCLNVQKENANLTLQRQNKKASMHGRRSLLACGEQDLN